VLDELGDQRLAFGLRQSLDAHDVGGVGIERLAAGFLVGAHDRMHGGRQQAILGLEQFVAATAASAIDVLGLQPVDARLEPLGQRVVGLVHAGEQRVAAVRRDGDGVELRALADLLVPRRIGVPAAAAVVDRLVDLAIGLARADAHHRQLGILGVPRALDAVRLDPAKAARVGEELGDGE
jgi:hypothetical protein